MLFSPRWSHWTCRLPHARASVLAVMYQGQQPCLNHFLLGFVVECPIRLLPASSSTSRPTRGPLIALRPRSGDGTWRRSSTGGTQDGMWTVSRILRGQLVVRRQTLWCGDASHGTFRRYQNNDGRTFASEAAHDHNVCRRAVFATTTKLQHAAELSRSSSLKSTWIQIDLCTPLSGLCHCTTRQDCHEDVVIKDIRSSFP